MDEKTFLLAILDLSDGLFQADDTKITGAVTSLNSGTLTDVQVNKVKTTILSFYDNNTNSIVSIALLTSTINSINGINKTYLIGLLNAQQVNLADSVAAKTTLSANLQDKTIVFDNDFDKYNYYYTLVNLVINLRDNTLTQLAITAVQAL